MDFFFLGQKFVEEDIDGKALLTKRLEEDTTLEKLGFLFLHYVYEVFFLITQSIKSLLQLETTCNLRIVYIILLLFF